MIKNLFITFEGCEGTGKSSQLKLLVNTLKKTSIKFIATREPGGSKEGERIREILLNHRLTIQPFCETLLHMAARYQNLKEGKKSNKILGWKPKESLIPGLNKTINWVREYINEK